MRSVERTVTAALKVMFYSHRCLPFLTNQNTKNRKRISAPSSLR